MDVVGLVAVILTLGTPAYIVKIVLASRERRARLELEARNRGALASGDTKLLHDENKVLRERVANLESIVCSVDFELNQKIAKLLESSTAAPQLAPGPAPASAPAPSPSPPAAAPPVVDRAAGPAPTPAVGGSPPVEQGVGRTMTAHAPARPAGNSHGELRPGDLLAQRYQVQRLLGRGGMGAVYLANDEVLGEQVALKIIASSSAPWDPSLVERFRREAAAARKISSPNVIRIHDLGEAAPGLLYISMEYFPGRTLAQVMAQRGILPLETCRDYLQQICVGLAAAHAASVIHRDLKPANIMVGERDAVRIIDFGLAKARAEEGLTATGALLGTPLYMAPEQVRGKAIDARTDIYALGAMAFHMVTGRPPFVGENPIATGFAHLTEAPLRARSLRPDLPQAWDDVIFAALAKAPADRPDSALAFRDRLSA
jgi:serine/threonine-protein kinase